MLLGNNASNIDIENSSEINYKPDELLGNIVLMYVYIGVN